MINFKNKRTLVTSALPYANGSIHVGHLVEYIQTDIFVRFLRLIGEDAIYICADDTHGAPIEINAKKQNITPEELIAKYHKEHIRDFKSFQIQFDSYYSTNSDENKYYADLIFERLKKKDLIYTKPIQQTYCESCKRFLPDRYVRGECPKCHAQDQYGDVCESCSSTHSTSDLIHPHCSLCRSPATQKESVHYFFKLSALSKQLEEWLLKNKQLQQEIVNYVKNWIKEGLQDWDISRDGPYFGFKIPGEENKYYYVWLDAPIGYIASTANYCNSHPQYKLTADNYWQDKNNNTEIIHVIGKDIIYFHFLFWPAVLLAADFNLPNYLVVHGFLTVNGEKMSKSRGTFFTAQEFLEQYKPEHLRFYYAGQLSKKMSDVDLNFQDLHDRINSELVGNISNFCYRTLSFLKKNFEGKFKDINEIKEITNKYERVRATYQDFNSKEALATIQEISAIGNRYLQEKQPWQLVKDNKIEEAQKILGTCVNIAKDLSILLSPILPKYSAELQQQLNISKTSWDNLGFNLKNHTISSPEIIEKKIDFEPLKLEKDEKIEEIKYEVKTDDYKVRVAQLKVDKIKNKHEGLEKLKKQIEKEVEKYIKNDILDEYEAIDKVNGVDRINSVKNLINLIKEKGQLPQINTAVDAYNITSTKHLVSLATHDITKIEGTITVRKASKKDNFVSIDGKSEVLGKNETIYSDDKKVLGRASKQCLITKTINSTKNLLLMCWGNSKHTEEQVDAAIKEACELIVKYCGGEYKILKETTNKTKQKSPKENIFPLLPKVAKIISVENHPDADKLYILKIDTATEVIQLVAGIKQDYKPEELLDKKIVFLSNLKPAKIRGEKSNGMILGAEQAGKYTLLDPTNNSQIGDIVFVEGFENKTSRIEYKDFQEIKLKIKNKRILFNNLPLKTKSCEVEVNVKDGSSVA